MASFDSKVMYSPPVDLIMDNFQEHIAEDREWISPPFTTQPNGYQMCLKVDPNGYGPGRSTHLCVAVRLMKGEHDEHLSWPLRGTLTVQLINQKHDTQHVEHKIKFSGVYSDDICGKVVNGIVTDVGIIARLGPAIGEFIKLAELLSPSDQTCYLHHNKLRFRIKHPVLYTSQVSSRRPNSTTSPGKYVAEFTMTNFQKYRVAKDAWYSPPFYTHDGGYKLSISVYANGVDRGAGRHVSIYIVMVASPNDDQLKWPFLGSITVQITNWKCDRNHVQRTLDIDPGDNVSKRVIGGLICGHGTGWHTFISHQELLDTTSEDISYIEDDTIKLRVLDIQCWRKATTLTTGTL